MSAVTDEPPRAPARRPETPVSVQARGQLRVLRTALKARADALQKAADGVPHPLLAQVAQCTSKGRDRAMAQILLAMPELPLHREKRGALWRLFTPAADDAIIVEALAIGAHGTGGWTRSNFGLFFSFHSLARLLDRSAFSADPLVAMTEAHDSLLALRPAEGEAVFALRNIVLPAADGAFLCTTELKEKTSDIRAIVKTWLSEQQLRGTVEEDISAWANLLASAPPTTA